MPSLAQVAQNSATVTFSWGGLDWTVEYRPSALTDAIITQLNSTPDDINAALVAIVKSWNITEPDGVTPFPIVAERLGELPFPLREAMSKAVWRDARPN